MREFCFFLLRPYLHPLPLTDPPPPPTQIRLNIPDIALQSFAPAAAAPAAPAEETAAEEPVQEKTMFNLRLQSFEASAKPKVIKEVKSLLGLSLVDSKKFVESAPKMLKEGLTKEEAEKIQKVLKDLGAVAVLE